jgi:Tfp pilus assembly protein PilF
MTAATTQLRNAAAALVLAGLAGCAHGPAATSPMPQNTAASPVRARLPDGPRPPSLAERLAEGDRLRDSGDMGKAAFEYFRALRAAPDSATARERIAFLQIDRDPNVAEGIFAGLIQEQPVRATAHLGRGLAQLQRGDLPAAREALERALELDPRSADAEVALAMTCEGSAASECAARNYDRALALDANNADLHNNRGMSLLITGKFAAAADEFRLALRGRPGDRAVQNNLGLALGRAGDTSSALAAFRAAGDEASALNNMGYVHYLNGDPQRAIEHYERALAARPADPLPILRNLRDAQLRVTEQQLVGSAQRP